MDETNRGLGKGGAKRYRTVKRTKKIIFDSLSEKLRLLEDQLDWCKQAGEWNLPVDDGGGVEATLKDIRTLESELREMLSPTPAPKKKAPAQGMMLVIRKSNPPPDETKIVKEEKIIKNEFDDLPPLI